MKLYLYYATSIFCALFLSIGDVYAQQDTVLNAYTGQTEISAKGSVKLTAGFYIPTGKTVRVFIRNGFDNWANLRSKPTTDQNYILTRTFKTPFVMDAAAAGSNAYKAHEVNQTIQYIDGLGRQSQIITVQGSPNFDDVVKPIVYDAMGRESQKYLPYVAASTGGTFRSEALKAQGLFYTSPTAGIALNSYPYGVTVFGPSPLNQAVEIGSPGAPWQPVVNSTAGHTGKIEYGTNDDEVKLWIVGSGGAETKVNYAAGSLYKTTSKDENWKSADLKAGTTDEYKDFEGHIVLRRLWESNTKSLSTYYLYDDFGNLNYVLPPAVNENGQALISSFNEDQNVFKQFIYGYSYDEQNRLIKKQVPGKGWESMVYNDLDQVVLTQDENLKLAGQWGFTKYDVFGRIVMSGIYSDKSERKALQGTMDTQKVLYETRSTSDIGYGNLSFPQEGIISYHVINYYDNYKFLKSGVFDPSVGVGQVGEDRTKSLLTGTKINILGTNNMLLSVYYYDAEGQVLQTKSQNHLGGRDIIDNTYNFAGELTSSKRSHTISGQDNATVIANRYLYDHMGRKIATKESINGQPEVVLSKMDYTETGQLLSKQLHSTNDGSSYLQKTAYTYNERGWLSKSTSAQFNLQLNYNDGEKPQWNGNIANQYWGGSLEKKFTYSYDRLNRLTDAVSSGLGESISYDIMGNILTLNRDGYGTNVYSGYTGNQLTKITGFTNSNYVYDGNGNLKSDSEKNINLTYNYLNLPEAITGAKTINYTYDANGNKLRKKSTSETIDYINKIQHNSDGTIDIIITDEGVARNNNGIFSYEYNLNDHLGNVRYSFRKHPITGSLERIQSDDYYAFGQRKSSGSPISLNNKYLYNGKEIQDELGGLYDYGARLYDPVIGRWNVVDPLAEQDRKTTPYAYGFDDPIRHTDPDGMFGEDVNDDQDGPGPTTRRLGSATQSTGSRAGAIFKNTLKASAAAIVIGLGPEDPVADVVAGGIFIVGGSYALGTLIYDHVNGPSLSSAASSPDKGSQGTKKTLTLEERAAKLDKKPRDGQDFTPTGKKVVKEQNSEKNGGKMKCANCEIEVKNGKKHERGVTPPSDEAHVDHKKRKREGGSGTPNNGQVLCRGCNLDKH